jgi:hypothetical protein
MTRPKYAQLWITQMITLSSFSYINMNDLVLKGERDSTKRNATMRSLK